MLCSLCVCNGVAVRANQNLICDHLLPKRDLLLQTQLVNDVQRLESHPYITPPFHVSFSCILVFSYLFTFKCKFEKAMIKARMQGLI